MSVGDVVHGQVPLRKLARTFKDIIDAQCIPLELPEVTLRGEGDGVIVYGDQIVGNYLDDGAIVEISHGRIVADEVDEVFDCDTGVIDGDDLNI